MGCFCSVNEGGGTVFSLPSRCLHGLCCEVRLIGQSDDFRRHNCPFTAKGWDVSVLPDSFHSCPPSGCWWLPSLVLQRVHMWWWFPLKLLVDHLVYQSSSCSWPSVPELNLYLLLANAPTFGLFCFCCQRTLKQLWTHLCKYFLVIFWVFPPR